MLKTASCIRIGSGELSSSRRLIACGSETNKQKLIFSGAVPRMSERRVLIARQYMRAAVASERAPNNQPHPQVWSIRADKKLPSRMSWPCGKESQRFDRMLTIHRSNHRHRGLRRVAVQNDCSVPETQGQRCPICCCRQRRHELRSNPRSDLLQGRLSDWRRVLWERLCAERWLLG